MRLALAAAASMVALASVAAYGAAPPAADAQAVFKAAGGIVVAYPKSWRAAVAAGGTVIGIAGPAGGGVRPAATIVLVRASGEMRELMDSASRGIQKDAPARLLGEHRLNPSRWARYYLRGDGRTAEYVVVGIASGGGWTATMVAVDAASDPDLPRTAGIFQRILADLVMPG